MRKVEIRYHENNSNDDECILLGRIIQKAKKNGYIHKYKFSIGFMVAVDNAQIYKIIFSHEFAKAFWGEFLCEHCHNESLKWEGGSCPFCGRSIYDKVGWIQYKNWKYHQHKMLDEVQEEKDPLKYLEKFL